MKYILFILSFLLMYPNIVYANETSCNNTNECSISLDDTISPKASDYLISYSATINSTATSYINVGSDYHLKSNYSHMKVTMEIYEASSGNCVSTHTKTLYGENGTYNKDFKLTSGTVYFAKVKFVVLDEDGKTLETNYV